ncbi:MAG: hypothetical protein LBL82_00305 [Oscillospiraceae bacterium]|jgi:hypothetical protein|nr:hypothetical protein [Oscillospiraceae bacterium]
MTAAQMKQNFVENELTAVLKKLDKRIFGAEYEQKDCEEFVCVYEKHLGEGCKIVKGRKIFTACVTADSLGAIVTDVLRAGDYGV